MSSEKLILSLFGNAHPTAIDICARSQSHGDEQDFLARSCRGRKEECQTCHPAHQPVKLRNKTTVNRLSQYG